MSGEEVLAKPFLSLINKKQPHHLTFFERICQLASIVFKPFVLIKMNLGYPKEQLGNSSRLEIFCSSSPNMKFIWDSTQKTSLQLAIVIATVACRIHCPFKHRSDWNDKKVRQLQTNSNILIASLAAAGLLVGAVCMPLTISLDIHFLVWK
ncbi:hypothetical protein pdam_00016586 [Pocillopora damicornis]|uniref:Uncharacterized protein n=1 Tax=Pocillopora damicornis TaxID=46731 RepID=A0A3M6T6P7_POCDA|nr:hypothetical protein pdam_00016586 [Pocillopora damicornis]